MTGPYVRLPQKKKEFIVVDYADLNLFIQHVYGHEWDFVSDHGAHNFSTYEFSGINGEQLGKYDQGKLDDFLQSGHFSCIARILLGDLAYHGVIEVGDYLIDVFW